MPLDRHGAGLDPLASIRLEDALWFSAAIIIGVGVGTLLRLRARSLLGPMTASAAMHVIGITTFELPSIARAILDPPKPFPAM